MIRTFMQTGSFTDTVISNVDVKIAIWQSLLPACKKDPLRKDGRVDEVMFLAHLSTTM
jgi:nicotinate-nucleotide pyrophosphorylase (carboxylating)